MRGSTATCISRASPSTRRCCGSWLRARPRASGWTLDAGCVALPQPAFPARVLRREGAAGAGCERALEHPAGRLMLDAWLYRNLHFPRESFDEKVLRELVASAPSSIRLDA